MSDVVAIDRLKRAEELHLTSARFHKRQLSLHRKRAREHMQQVTDLRLRLQALGIKLEVKAEDTK